MERPCTHPNARFDELVTLWVRYHVDEEGRGTYDRQEVLWATEVVQEREFYCPASGATWEVVTASGKDDAYFLHSRQKNASQARIPAWQQTINLSLIFGPRPS